MKEQFVTYEIAKKLKELGFDIEFRLFENNVYFVDNKFSICNEEYRKLFPEKEYILTSLWQQVIDWFEREFDLYIRFDLIGHNKIFHTFQIYSTGIILPVKETEIVTSYYGECYESYKKCMEKAILKVIELITNK